MNATQIRFFTLWRRELNRFMKIKKQTIGAGKLNLWTYDSQHGSSAGYILAALVVFGQLTGRDPLSLGDREHVAMDLGLSPAQMHALEQVAHDELVAHDVKLAMN